MFVDPTIDYTLASSYNHNAWVRAHPHLPPDIPLSMYQRAAETNKYIATAAPVKQDRVELIHYIKEQSISYEYHRYGSGQDQEPAIE